MIFEKWRTRPLLAVTHRAFLVTTLVAFSGCATTVAKIGLSDPPAPSGHFAGTTLDSWLIKWGVTSGDPGMVAFLIPALIDLPLSFIADVLCYPFEEDVRPPTSTPSAVENQKLP